MGADWGAGTASTAAALPSIPKASQPSKHLLGFSRFGGSNGRIDRRQQPEDGKVGFMSAHGRRS